MIFKNSVKIDWLKTWNLPEEKKHTPRAQIFRYFCIESRNNYAVCTGIAQQHSDCTAGIAHIVIAQQYFLPADLQPLF